MEIKHPFMKSSLIISLSLLASFTYGQIRLFTPGEHLKFALESFNHKGEVVTVAIYQGETWTAFYTRNGHFKTREEIIDWDTTKNFKIQSDTTVQPDFYIQGMPDILNRGLGTKFNWNDFHTSIPPIYSLHQDKYLILYSDDLNCQQLVSKKYGQIKSDKNLTIFKDVNDFAFSNIKLKDEKIVKLYWVGDLNGDGEPDLLLIMPSHHETLILELIVSEKDKKGTKWKRVARFTESS